MKLHALLLVAVLLVGCSQAPSNAVDTQAAPAEDTKMPAAEPASMASETSAMSAAAATKASASGTVEAIDAATGKITISHGPVDALKWPAMTMGFKAAPALLTNVAVGDKVAFDLKLHDGSGEVTAIAKQ